MNGNEVVLNSTLAYDPIVNGIGNIIHVGHYCHVSARIEVNGDNNVISIQDFVQYNHGWLGIHANGARIEIGVGSTIGGATISAHETGSIKIGKDCMLSVDVFMDVSDMHPIFCDLTGLRINPAKDIIIGEHVWLGNRVLLTKGAQVEDGAIVGAGSLVVGRIPSKVIAVGNPARVIRENVCWRRDF